MFIQLPSSILLFWEILHSCIQSVWWSGLPFNRKVTYLIVAGHAWERFYFSTVPNEVFRISSNCLDRQDNLMIEHADKLEQRRLFD